MAALVNFMASTAGRAARVVAGIILILVGLLVIGETAGLIVAIIGLVPIAAGVFDFCLLAPLFGLPFAGPKIRGKSA
jgi:hypothetical protein